MPFYFPPELDIYADQWVADVANSIGNSRSRPSTADIIVTGQRRIEHYKYPGLKLGDVCMVTEFLDKRRREAMVLDISAKLIHVAELGVCLGYSRDVPGAFNFIAANGTIFPRRVVDIVQVHPFDWKRKKVFRAELLLPSVDIDASPQISSQASVQAQPAVVNDSLNTLPFLPVSHMPVSLSSVNGLSSLDTVEEHVTSAEVQQVVVQHPLLAPVTDYCGSITPAEVDPSSNNTVLSPARNVLAKQRKQSGSIISLPVDSSSAENHSSPIGSVSAVISPARHSNGRPIRSNSGVSFNQRKQNESLNSENGSANVASVSCDVGNQWCTPRQSVSISQARRAYSANSDMFISNVKQKIGESNLVSVSVAAPFAKASATKIHAKSSSGRKQRSDALTSSERVIIDAAIAENHAHWGHAVDTQCDDELDLNQAFTVIADYNAGTNKVRSCAFAARAVSISSAELVPIPSDKCKEIPLRQALRDNGEERLTAATLIEIDKQQGIGCLSKSDIFSSKDELPTGSIVVDAHVLYKLKADGRETCRIAAMGNRLPPLPNSLTFASVVNESSKMFCVAAMQAHCAKRHEDLIFSDADVVGGF